MLTELFEANFNDFKCGSGVANHRAASVQLNIDIVGPDRGSDRQRDRGRTAPVSGKVTPFAGSRYS
jgi:hypothetical protein